MSFILDNLIAAEKARPMLIVMEQGYARKPDEPPVPLRPPGSNARAMPPDFSRMFATLDEVFTKDLLPLIDSTYRTLPDREHRALAGLSMGAGQALNFGLSHLDTFAWVGGFSAAPNTHSPEKLLPDAAARQKLKLLWLSCGDKDGLFFISQRTHRYLAQNNVPHIWQV